ncbi:MAG: hypothetical protein ACYC1A_02195 [Spirochaetales bacterium]|jgi:hypothetical protein
MDIAGIIAILSALIGVPLIVFGFVLLNLRNKRSVEKIRLQKEILELELQKEQIRLKMLEAENVKYDRLIEHSEK